jgi:hypothetical protein
MANEPKAYSLPAGQAFGHERKSKLPYLPPHRGGSSITMTSRTTPSGPQTGYYFETTHTVEFREYETGAPSRLSMPSELAPLSPRRSRDRDQHSNHNDSASEPYDPDSAMSVFSAWGAMFSDEVGARDDSNGFRDQRGPSVWGGHDLSTGHATRSSEDAAQEHTTAPDCFSDLASMLFSTPAVIGPEGNWYYDQHVYSQLGRSTEDSDASYVSARTSLDSAISDLPSLSEAESEVASPSPGSNAGSGASSSVSSLHALSETSFATGESGRAQGPTDSTLAGDGGLGSDEARRAAKGKATVTAGAADSEWIEASKIVFSDGDGRRLPPDHYVYTLQTDSHASGMPPQRPAPPLPRRNGDGGRLPSAHHVSTLRTDPRASGMPPQRPAPPLPRRNGDGGRLPSTHHVSTLRTDPRASGMPPQRPAPPLPRRS